MVQLQKNGKKSPAITAVMAALLFVFLMIISTILFILYPFATSVKNFYFEGENPILFHGKQMGNGLIIEKSVYVPFSFMKEFIDDTIHYDEDSNSVIITTKDKVVQMPSESLTYYVNEKPVKLHFSPIKDKDGEIFVALDPLLNYYPIKYKLLPDTNAIWINEHGEEIVHGKITTEKVHVEKLRLRTDATLRSPYLAQTDKGENIYIEGEKEGYYYVRKVNGIAGYVNKNYVEMGKTEKIVVEHNQKETKLRKIEGPISLTWEAVYTKNPNTKNISHMSGVNVISPTWFHLMNEKGDISNRASLEYVRWAKKEGYEVWGLFSNSFDPDLTHETFKSFKTRQKMIRQLLHYSQIYQLSGINLDIENVYPEDGPYVTQFVRELTPYLHEAGLVVSMDITFIAEGNWSAFYERDKLAQIVDYLIVMAYDEHWSTSPVAGSVASLPWVEKNLQKLLEIVPNKKLILGVPLYTRLWEINKDGEVSSKALSMEQAKQWMAEHNLTPTYDDSTGQNYVELYSKKKNVTYKMWLEDELSLQKRAKLVEKYDLAGIASWARYFADESAWTALNLERKTVTKK